MSILPAISVKVDLTPHDEGPLAGYWEVRAQAEYRGEPYLATHAVPRNAYAFALPTIMSRMVYEVAHQIITTLVGNTNEPRL